MKKIYSNVKQATVAVALFLSLVSSEAIGQATAPCGVVVEDFQSSTTSTMGFNGTGFTVGTQGSRRFLQRTGVVGNVTYTLTTPTYTLPANQTVIGYGFVLAGSEQVANVTAKIQYVVNGQVTTVTLTSFVPTYSGGTGNASATVCRGINISELPGFPTSGSYRFVLELTPISGSGGSANFTFDDFRTTGLLSQITLPVTFIGVDAKQSGSNILVSWTVAGEENVAGYEVERSADGRDFTSISKLAATRKVGYSFVDANTGGVVYYRIKNIDNDGKFKYSSIVRLNNGKASIVVKAFPQPVASQLTVQHPSVSKNATLTISTADGRVVNSLRPNIGNLQTSVDMSKLQKGLYLVRFDDGEGNVETLKVVKQ